MNKFYDKLVTYSGVLGSLWIAVLMMIITIDVGGRTFFNKPMVGTPEIVSNSIVAIAFLQITYVLLQERHVRVTVFYEKFSEKFRNILDIFAFIVGFLLFLALIYSSWELFQTAVKVGEFEGEGAIRIPTSPVRFIILFGSLIMAIQFIILIIGRIRQLIKSKSTKTE